MRGKETRDGKKEDSEAEERQGVPYQSLSMERSTADDEGHSHR